MRRPLFAAIVVMSGLTTARAAENELTVIGGFDVAFKTLTLDIADGESVFKSDFMTVAPYVGIGYGPFYGSFSIDKSTGSEPTPSDDNSTSAGTLQHARKDVTLTFGYRATPTISVFGGYTVGENSFLETRFEDSGCPGGGGTPGVDPCGLVVGDISYKERGPFLGFAYNKGFASGALSFSAAYGLLEGKLDIKQFPDNSDNDIIDGDNTGISYGLTWTGPVTESLNYRVGYKKTHYEMKEQDFHIAETYSSFFFGISNYF